MNEKPSFFSELKRRNVYKVAVAYGVVGWLVIQVTATIVPALHLPDAITTAVVVLVLIGFPIALVISWAFEMTPEGMKRTADVSGEDVRSMPYWSKKKFAGFIVGAVIIAAGLLAYQLLRPYQAARRANFANPEALIPEKSIAVLPFENLSEDKANVYFASGIQDEILTKLTAINDLKVISRASTEKYRSHPEDIKKVASELGAAVILEGSVQKAGDSAHINVQLIDARTDSHVWAQVYDRQLKNIFAVEGDVAEQVAAALKLKLLPSATAQLEMPPTKNAEAYDLYLRGMYAHKQWFRGIGEVDEAYKYFREAIAQDPDFAAAYAWLSITESQEASDEVGLNPALREGCLEKMQTKLSCSKRTCRSGTWPWGWFIFTSIVITRMRLISSGGLAVLPFRKQLPRRGSGTLTMQYRQ